MILYVISSTVRLANVPGKVYIRQVRDDAIDAVYGDRCVVKGGGDVIFVVFILGWGRGSVLMLTSQRNGDTRVPLD